MPRRLVKSAVRTQGKFTMREDAKERPIKTIPFNKLKYIDPVAAHIKRELGKEFNIVTMTGLKKGEIKKSGVDTVIWPQAPGAVYGRGKKTIPLEDSLVVIQKLPKGLCIRVNSRMGLLAYHHGFVAQAKKAVEEVLKNRGMAFTAEEKVAYTNYKINLVGQETHMSYGAYHKPPAQDIIDKTPKWKHTEFRTGRLKEPFVPYHR